MKRILTGIRPTGNLHLGHYFGATKNWVKLQDEYDTYIEIADVQALTDNFDNPEKIRTNVKELAIDLLSVGINPERTKTPMRIHNFGIEPDETLLSSEKVAIATIQTLLSDFTGQVIDVKRANYE